MKFVGFYRFLHVALDTMNTVVGTVVKGLHWGVQRARAGIVAMAM
jgi:hypothetical protein